MIKQDALFCVGQKAVINREGKILLLHDPLPEPGNFDLPGGKIQEGEHNFIKALQREVREESGLKIKVGSPYYVDYFEFSKNSVHRNRGKKIYLVFFSCEYISGNVRLSDEHDQYLWVDKSTFTRVFVKKNKVYEALRVYFNALKS